MNLIATIALAHVSTLPTELCHCHCQRKHNALAIVSAGADMNTSRYGTKE